MCPLQKQNTHWSENKMSAGALMWICAPLYIIENETFSQEKGTETLSSQFRTQDFNSLLQTGFHYLFAVWASPYCLVVSRISWLDARI